jgi:hypothetical protein
MYLLTTPGATLRGRYGSAEFAASSFDRSEKVLASGNWTPTNKLRVPLLHTMNSDRALV